MTEHRVHKVAAPLRAQVLAMLRQDIVGVEFEPGERLVEARLCTRYDVSRSVVREVLRQLESEGLVENVANRGPVVARLTAFEAEALSDVRAVLEGLAGALFAERATTTQRDQLQAVMHRISHSYVSSDLNERLAMKDSFYAVLIEGSANPVVETMLQGLHARVQLLRGLSMQAEGRAHDTLEELAAIVDAAAVRANADDARQACERHVRSAAATALSELAARENGAQPPAPATPPK